MKLAPKQLLLQPMVGLALAAVKQVAVARENTSQSSSKVQQKSSIMELSRISQEFGDVSRAGPANPHSFTIDARTFDTLS